MLALMDSIYAMSTSTILAKWKEQGNFIRFLDGDTHNCAVTNLCNVNIQEAMEHFDEWVFDWDLNLTKKERRLVMDAEWRRGLIFG